jgi:lipocalin
MHAIVPFMYAGDWYEVASKKEGFYGLGQYDCTDTRGTYEYDSEHEQFLVTTQCHHLNGRVSGIRGIVKCPKKSLDCTLRFPTAPYIPPAMYKVLETDYDTYALVEGSNKSFVQIYSRSPRPGNKFIEAMKEKLKQWGYQPDDIHVTPVTNKN